VTNGVGNYEDGDLMMEEDVVRGKEERTKSSCNRTDLSQTVTNPLPFPSTTIVPPIPSSQPFPFGQALKFSFAHPPAPFSFLLYFQPFTAYAGSFP